MYRRDYFLNETQRLAQLIAKLLGLKNTAGQEQEVKKLYQDTLNDEYQMEAAVLQAFGLNEFREWLNLNQSAWSAAKLNTLAQLLYYDAEPFKPDTHTLLQLQKVIILLDVLEQQYHLQLFENISKRQIIDNYIKQHHA